MKKNSLIYFLIVKKNFLIFMNNDLLSLKLKNKKIFSILRESFLLLQNNILSNLVYLNKKRYC